MSSIKSDIKQLKQLILELAMRGKLVPQDPNDEPARLLLEKMKTEKLKLIKEGKIKKEKLLPEILPEDMPFKIPSYWRWVHSEDCFIPITTSGIKEKKTSFQLEGTIPIIDQGQKFIAGYSNTIENFCKVSNPVTIFGDHTRITKFIDFDFVPGADGVKIMEPLVVNARYFYFVILYNSKSIDNRGYSRHYKYLLEKKFPLPPLDEQKRIVQKIDNLMKLCDEIDQRGISLEDKLKELKSAILQSAIQGKLVPQDSRDEPASVLFEKIQVEKSKLIKDGKIKKENLLPEIKPVQIPFEIPSTWRWVRLSEISQKITDGTHKTPNYINSGIPFLSVKNFSGGTIDFDNIKYISQNEHLELSKRCNIEKNDIILTKVGTTGIAKVVDTDKEFSIFVSLALLKGFPEYILPKYLEIFLNSPLGKKQSVLGTEGVGNKNLVLRKIANFIVSIPPYSEQQKISQKVGKLMNLENKLEEMFI